jgi:CMP-N-acetylneuraminic acid synthetase
MSLRTIGLVPGRGGSKGIPRKNIRPLCGRPLLEYTADAALASRSLARVLLSTDDLEVAEVGRRCGLEVPFIRPAHLAADETPTLDVVRHAIAWLEEHGEHLDAVCVLQPTHPFRRVEDIDACVELLDVAGADAVVTVLAVPPEYNPHWTYEQDQEGTLHISTGEVDPVPRRQDLPAAFRREGSVYVTRRNVIMDRNSMYGTRMLGYLVSERGRVNIDTLDDWARAEQLLREGIDIVGDAQR